MTVQVRNFTIQDYDSAVQLWKAEANIGLSLTDTKEAISLFLKRNPGFSKVTVADGVVAATLLCGHDGRRGYLYHLCVDKRHRRKKLGTKLVAACLCELEKAGIRKCHLFIFRKNRTGKRFWKDTGWSRRVDIEVFSRDT
jgi:ribosomal protein S18 acetylase RimI-like enzyme